MKEVIAQIEALTGESINDEFINNGTKEVRKFRCLVIGILKEFFKGEEICAHLKMTSSNLSCHIKDCKDMLKMDYSFKQEYTELRKALVIKK